MRLTTIFSAYILSEREKAALVRNRALGRFGIAVDKDANALAWQRFDRQSRAFERRLWLELAKIDNAE